jgi:hypothetical protein
LEISFTQSEKDSISSFGIDWLLHHLGFWTLRRHSPLQVVVVVVSKAGTEKVSAARRTLEKR